jgi:hypothetical protein
MLTNPKTKLIRVDIPQSYEIKLPPWAILGFKILVILSVVN